MAWWVTFSDGKGRCFEGKRDDVEQRATSVGAVKSIQQLPYPAEPRDETDRTDCPSFCYSPKQCQGRGACPKSYACSE